MKSLTWRLIGTFDTFLLSYFITNNITFASTILFLDFFIKFALYYLHEKIWFMSKFKKASQRHLLKTFSWRILGSLTTLILALIITGNSFTSLKIGLVETITKMLLYYIHEKLWYRINFGLNIRISKHAN